MTREIKFRGKRLDNGELVYGNLIGNDVIVGNIVEWDSEYFCTEFWLKVDPETVGQFTGLHDRNGKEIYEGDIVKGQHISSPYPDLKFQRIIGKVCYSGVKFRIEGVKQYVYHYCDLDSSFEIIGNIYENPELLEATP